MNFRNYLGFVGSVLVLAGCFAPMVHLPIIGNWNYFDLDLTLSSVVCTLGFFGFLSAAFKRRTLAGIFGWAIAVLLVLTFVGVYVKVHSSFSFIPFKKLAALAAGIVKYRSAGWVVMGMGAVLMIVSGRKDRISPQMEVV